MAQVLDSEGDFRGRKDKPWFTVDSPTHRLLSETTPPRGVAIEQDIGWKIQRLMGEDEKIIDFQQSSTAYYLEPLNSHTIFLRRDIDDVSVINGGLSRDNPEMRLVYYWTNRTTPRINRIRSSDAGLWVGCYNEEEFIKAIGYAESAVVSRERPGRPLGESILGLFEALIYRARHGGREFLPRNIRLEPSPSPDKLPPLARFKPFLGGFIVSAKKSGEEFYVDTNKEKVNRSISSLERQIESNMRDALGYKPE